MKLWVGLRTPNLGKEQAVGDWGGDGTVRNSVGKFLSGLHSNFSSIFTRFREILPLQHATFSIPPLVSPKFPHVPLGVGGWPLGYKERRRWANCPGI